MVSALTGYFYDSEYVIKCGRSRVKARGEFARMVCNGIMRMCSRVSTTSSNMFWYMTMSDMDCIDKSNAVTEDRIESW